MSGAGQGRFRPRALWLHPRRIPAFWWFLVAAVLVAADIAAGPHVQFAVAFSIPVFLAA
jgi:hypothetical protein